MGKVCVGVDIGGTTVKIGLFTESGEIMRKWEIVTRKEEQGKYVLPDVADSIMNVLKEENVDKEDVLGIGIGVPGPVVEERKVLYCVNIGWGEIAVADEMERLTGIGNVKVANDGNVAALGEMRQGGGKGYDSIIMVTLGTGVGGGVILNGKILTGSSGSAGEIGHILVNTEETQSCNCGKKGCLEQYASATGIVRMTKLTLEQTQQPSVLRDMENLSAKAVFDAAKEGDTLAMDMVEQLGRYLGIALSHVAQVVDPQAFIIGGGVSRAGSILTDTIQKYFDGNVMEALKGKAFCLATLGNDAGICGSAGLILSE